MVVLLSSSLLLFLWLRFPARRDSRCDPRRPRHRESKARLRQTLGLDDPYVPVLALPETGGDRNFGASTGVLPGKDAFGIFLTVSRPPSRLSTFAIVVAVLAVPTQPRRPAASQAIRQPERHGLADQRRRAHLLPLPSCSNIFARQARLAPRSPDGRRRHRRDPDHQLLRAGRPAHSRDGTPPGMPSSTSSLPGLRSRLSPSR